MRWRKQKQWSAFLLKECCSSSWRNTSFLSPRTLLLGADFNFISTFLQLVMVSIRVCSLIHDILKYSYIVWHNYIKYVILSTNFKESPQRIKKLKSLILKINFESVFFFTHFDFSPNPCECLFKHFTKFCSCVSFGMGLGTEISQKIFIWHKLYTLDRGNIQLLWLLKVAPEVFLVWTHFF